MVPAIVLPTQQNRRWHVVANGGCPAHKEMIAKEFGAGIIGKIKFFDGYPT